HEVRHTGGTVAAPGATRQAHRSLEHDAWQIRAERALSGRRRTRAPVAECRGSRGEGSSVAPSGDVYADQSSDARKPEGAERAVQTVTDAGSQSSAEPAHRTTHPRARRGIARLYC